MALLLAGSGALTGGLVGLAVGAAWSAVGGTPLGPVPTAAVILVALGLDAVAGHRPSLRPLAVRRQVPQAWGRLFGARLVAVLYGARLGVGPLTILRTWTWWAALVVGASLGPWPSAGVGACFALTRAVTTIVAGRGAGDGVAMQARVVTLTRAEPAVAAGAAGLLALTALGLALA